MTATKFIARVFEEPTGYFFCDDSQPMLDARGRCYRTKSDATRGAIECGAAAVVGSGVSRRVAREAGVPAFNSSVPARRAAEILA